MAHIQSPFGWSKRYLAAQQRAEGDPVKQASDQARLALLRKKDADLDLANGKINRAEHRRVHEEADEAIAEAADRHAEFADPADDSEPAKPAATERKVERKAKPQPRASEAGKPASKPTDGAEVPNDSGK